jgi:hypothetical protein
MLVVHCEISAHEEGIRSEEIAFRSRSHYCGAGRIRSFGD